MVTQQVAKALRYFRRPLLSTEEVAALLLEVASERKPFSFVRLGDSEGMLLLTKKHKLTEDDAAYLATHFDHDNIECILPSLDKELRLSLARADLIGMRDDIWYAAFDDIILNADDFDGRFRQILKLRPVESDISGHPLRRFYGLYEWMRYDRPLFKRICSAWVNFDLALAGFWERFFSSLSEVAIINCSSTLSGRIASRFNISVEHISIPDLNVHRYLWADDKSESIFPDSWRRVMSEIDKPQNGKVFLIGAGILGKSYARVIKERGGIALDVGGLMDAWDDRSTRPAVFQTKVGDSGQHAHQKFMFSPRSPDGA